MILLINKITEKEAMYGKDTFTLESLFVFLAKLINAETFYVGNIFVYIYMFKYKNLLI